MDDWRRLFDEQKTALESLQAGSQEQRDLINDALKLNREALDFANEGRTLEAHVQFKFVDVVLSAIKDGQYDSFIRLVQGIVGKKHR